jgi:hypothetical protein
MPLLAGLPLRFARLQFRLRLLAEARFPRYQGSMLRGGFGYHLRAASCSSECTQNHSTCRSTPSCAYRELFDILHPTDVTTLHDLRDVPRPFVIKPPITHQQIFAAGSEYTFWVHLFGRATNFLPFILFGFEQFARTGLGSQLVPAVLEQVDAHVFSQTNGIRLYHQGQFEQLSSGPYTLGTFGLPVETFESIGTEAERLSSSLCLRFHTPLRIKAHATILRSFDLSAFFQALSWRLSALSAFHGNAQWQPDLQALQEQVQAVQVARSSFRWHDWGRSTLRNNERQFMKLGGLQGEIELHGVSQDLRTLLLIGALTHVGKACVFGNGGYAIEDLEGVQA